MSSSMQLKCLAILSVCCLAASASGEQSLIRPFESNQNRTDADQFAQAVPAATLDRQSAQNVDAEFAACLLQANLAEVKLSKIAVDRATSENVKQFAQQSIKDHSAVADKLAALVGNQEPMDRRSKIDRQINERCLTMLQAELESKSGKEFDTCYVGSQIAGHMRMIAALDVLSSQTSGKLQQIVKASQPIVQKHYEDAQKLMNQVDERQASND